MALSILGISSQALAEQNEYKSVADRIHQEIYDKAHKYSSGEHIVKPNDPYQKVMNGVYGGSNTKGYKLDENGNDVPLDEQ